MYTYRYNNDRKTGRKELKEEVSGFRVEAEFQGDDYVAVNRQLVLYTHSEIV